MHQQSHVGPGDLAIALGIVCGDPQPRRGRVRHAHAEPRAAELELGIPGPAALAAQSEEELGRMAAGGRRCRTQVHGGERGQVGIAPCDRTPWDVRLEGCRPRSPVGLEVADHRVEEGGQAGVADLPGPLEGPDLDAVDRDVDGSSEPASSTDASFAVVPRRTASEASDTVQSMPPARMTSPSA